MISVNKQHYFINHILQKQKRKGMIQLKHPHLRVI
jgi:hypothetical protein